MLPENVDFADLLILKDAAFGKRHWRSEAVLTSGWKVAGWGLKKVSLPDDGVDAIGSGPVEAPLTDAEAQEVLGGLSDSPDAKGAIVEAVLIRLALWAAKKIFDRLAG
jgi:hypothetical protein